MYTQLKKKLACEIFVIMILSNCQYADTTTATYTTNCKNKFCKTAKKYCKINLRFLNVAEYS